MESEEIDYLVELPGYDGWSVKVLKDGTKVNRWQTVLNGWEALGRTDLAESDWRIMRARAGRAQKWIEENS